MVIVMYIEKKGICSLKNIVKGIFVIEMVRLMLDEFQMVKRLKNKTMNLFDNKSKVTKKNQANANDN